IAASALALASPLPISRPPAAWRWVSTASRAISRCMISLDPSKMRFTRMSRLRGLVAATAAKLHQLVDHLPRELRAVHLAQGGFDPDVVALVVGQARRDVEHRLEAERAAGDERQLLRDRVVLADRPTPLHALAGPLAGHLRGPLRSSDGDRHQRQAPRVQCAEGNLEPVPLARDSVLLGDEHVLK